MKGEKASSAGPPCTISPVPTRNKIKTTHGQLLTPAPGRLTPTGQGRIKAPPVCLDMTLKKMASSVDEFRDVCFQAEEADKCAEKALALDGKVNPNCVEEMPLNIEEWENKSQFESSNATVVTASSSSSSGGSVMGNEPAAIAPAATKKDPPLDVVRTDLTIHSEDEQPTTAGAKSPLAAIQMASSTASLSSSFTDNLIKENSSRQGRSLQRWLIHSPTEQLVRQVAGTIPITRDGRIILASASRKLEWILPKGGWDIDETKEECAARETFEEAGLLGRLGGCLEPIDYETSKAKKRRLSGNRKDQPKGEPNAGQKLKRSKGEDGELCPSLPKRVKTDEPMTATSARSELTSSSTGKVSSSESAPEPMTLFDPKNYSYVRLFLLPLYVTSVKSDWPEKGRLRKIVDIDEAIKIMGEENRIYFKRGLEMVKERGLHLLKP